MSDDQDPIKNVLSKGLQLYPQVDLEATIMTSVRKEAALRSKARRLRRRGMVFLLLFLFLMLLALRWTQIGYSHPAYESPLLTYGFVVFFLLVFFVQLEVWWRERGKTMG